jgi:predicted ATP-grasp superfamily ATP-dependent carboligase
MRILVTDGDQRAALAAVRSLGRAGHHVVVLSPGGRSLAGASRHARADLAVPSAEAEPAAFAEALVAAAARERAELVLPIGEAAILGALGARERLAPAVVPFPPLAAFRAVCDKPRVLECARGLGIAVPAQHVAHDAAALRALAGGALPYPVVLKPARSVAGAGAALAKHRVAHAADADALRRAAARFPASAYPVLVQQRIVGPGTGIFVLRWDGAMRARFAHRRLREKPPAGGVSVLAESVAVDGEPDLLARSLRLLEAFDWDGVAMVEYKRDAGTGTPYLMEINGRFWGSLQLAIDAGVDFPALLAACAAGRAPVVPPPYATGRRLRWFWGDVDHLLARLTRSAAALDLPPGAPGRARAVLDFVGAAFRRGQRGETWRLDDPAPFLRETALWFRGGRA